MIYYVYFIRVGTDGPIKIGYAYNIAKRLSTLQHGNPEELVCVGDIHCKNKKAAIAQEQSLHQQLQEFRLRGEWFTAAQEVLDVIPPAACPDTSACSTVLFDTRLERSPFSVPRSMRVYGLDEDPPWLNDVDRKNLATLSLSERRRMVVGMRKWCGS